MPRTLRRWSFLKKSPRHLGDDPGGPPERHSSRTVVAGRGAGGPEEQDRRGTRPRAPHDQRTSSVSIFGAICPQQGKGAALVLPRCDTQAMSLHLAEVAQAMSLHLAEVAQAMSLHLAEVAQAVAPGAHGVLLMDRAG